MEQKTSIFCIEPDAIYRAVLSKMFAGQPYQIRFAEEEDLEGQCAGFNEQLLFVSIELPGSSAFNLYPLIRRHRPDVPIVFFTNDNVNRYLKDLMNTEQTNVLAKPFTREEMLFLLDKLVHRDRAFGLKHYLKPGATVKTFFLKDSAEVRPHVDTLLDHAARWGFQFSYDFKIDLVIHELLINALYHAHGYEEEKKKGVPIVLPGDTRVEVEVGHDENRFGITITDFRGNLSRTRILQSLQALNRQQRAGELLEQGAEVGDIFKQHGRGIDIVRKNSGEYYFVIEKGKRTAVVIIFDKIFEKDDEYTSIKIIEV